MSDQTPVISVLTAFYNEQDYLDETIRSVLKQVYSFWELILVDDGSTDNSTGIARRYADSYPGKIRYFDHQGHRNRGLSASRNTGLENARGKLIAFLDADDIFEPNYLENQIRLYNLTQATMICEATRYWYSWNSSNSKKDEVIPVGATEDRLYQPRELNLRLYPLTKKAAPCMCGIIILRDVLINHGGFDESFTGLYEDQVFLAKIYYNEQVYISSACNNLYRQRSGSLMSSINDKGAYVSIRTRFLVWFKDYLEQRVPVDQRVYSLIKKNLIPFKYPRYYAVFHVLPRRFLNLLRRLYKRYTFTLN